MMIAREELSRTAGNRHTRDPSHRILLETIIPAFALFSPNNKLSHKEFTDDSRPAYQLNRLLVHSIVGIPAAKIKDSSRETTFKHCCIRAKSSVRLALLTPRTPNEAQNVDGL